MSADATAEFPLDGIPLVSALTSIATKQVLLKRYSGPVRVQCAIFSIHIMMGYHVACLLVKDGHMEVLCIFIGV